MHKLKPRPTFNQKKDVKGGAFLNKNSMKKYRFLAVGEALMHDDQQQLLDMTWADTKADGHIVTIQDNYQAPRFRRPVKFTGKTAFLVTYAPMIKVVVDTTGLNDKKIDMAIGLAAEQKFRRKIYEFLDEFQENIDWDETKEDTEMPTK